ncbi:unnamed protein product [Brassica rapa]|uniref:Factor of DNA methylation 1-5/IDN2 domain-containing protein n=1 Tax=Brassica campestris TaxID=3711 RepID=A0A8D9HMK3_BRACM|nr:unnamed protein product [Brassica rapa]
MDNSSSESEESDYSEKPYKQLRDGELKVKLKEETFKCPFCSERKKQRYKDKELLAHATAVSKSTARNCKQKANHLALSKYLHKDLAGDAEPVISLSKQKQAAVVNDDMYVWPWMGIVISPLRGNDDDKKTKRMQEFSRRNIDRILLEKEMLSKKLEYRMKDLDAWSKELDKKQALTELERLTLEEEKKKNDAVSSSLQLASLEQKRTDDRVLRLVEEHKRKKEEALNKILQLEKELNSKQQLQMEIQELKGKLQAMKHHREDEDDEEVKKKMKEMNEELGEKCSELQDLEDTNSALMIKERQSNDEIQEARQELITGLIGMLSGDRTNIRIKRLGELDEKPFLKACKERFKGEEAEVQYAMLCSKWQESLKDSGWYPFKRVGTEDKMKEVVDEEDEQLKKLREEWGEQVSEAVKTALEELNEYNPSGRYSVPALWNLKKKRNATLKEVIEYMTLQIKNLKNLKRKRKD